VQEAESYCYLRQKKKELVIVQEAEYSYYRTPCVIQQLLLYYYARADTSRKLVQEAEYPSSYYYDISGKLILAVNWCRRRSIPRATTTTWCALGGSSYVAQTSFPARCAAAEGKRRMFFVEFALAF
jgi:hypothetical protein